MQSSPVSEERIECPSVIVLAQSWNRIIKSIYGDERPMMAKQFGQLKTLRSRLGALTNEVISWSLNNWQCFALQAKEEACLPCAPPTPHIGFLLAHHDTARRMCMQAISYEKQLAEQEQYVAEPTKDPEHLMSHEAAWMIYLKSETASMRSKRKAVQHSYYLAMEGIKTAPEDEDAQARYGTAKNALEEQGKAEKQALKALGWGG